MFFMNRIDGRASAHLVLFVLIQVYRRSSMSLLPRSTDLWLWLCLSAPFWCWTHQASCEQSHLQILFRYHSAILLEHQQCIEISSLRIMLLVKPYPANTYFPFSWSGNQLESILALNLWQIFSLYISKLIYDKLAEFQLMYKLARKCIH